MSDVARVALVSSQFNKDAQFAPLLPWLPPATLACAALMLVITSRRLCKTGAVAFGTTS